MKLTILFPCRNEEEILQKFCKEIQDTMKNIPYSYEVIFVDNGSHDRSKEIIDRCGFCIVNESVQGYGAALRKGIAAARGEYIVFLDCDGSYPIYEVEHMVAVLESGCDMVIGSRFLGTIEDGAMPWLHRYVGTPFLTLLFRWQYGGNCTDINSGMRGLRKQMIDVHALSAQGMEFVVELSKYFCVRKLRVLDVPISYKKDYRTKGSHLRTFIDGMRLLKAIIMR